MVVIPLRGLRNYEKFQKIILHTPLQEAFAIMRLLLFIYMNYVNHFKANPRVVHPLEVLFSIMFS